MSFEPFVISVSFVQSHCTTFSYSWCSHFTGTWCPVDPNSHPERHFFVIVSFLISHNVLNNYPIFLIWEKVLSLILWMICTTINLYSSSIKFQVIWITDFSNFHHTLHRNILLLHCDFHWILPIEFSTQLFPGKTPYGINFDFKHESYTFRTSNFRFGRRNLNQGKFFNVSLLQSP